MTEKQYCKGDYTEKECEIWMDGEYIGIVRTDHADKFVELLNTLHEEKEQLLHIIDWCLTHHREVGHIVFDSRDEFFIWLKEKGVL
jgi:hypothetical protein